MPIPKLYEECLEGSRRVVLLFLRKHLPIRDGKQPQVTFSHVQGLAIYRSLEAFGIILTLSKNCNVKPVYIENGQGMFCPYLVCDAAQTRSTHFFLAHDFCGRRCAKEFNNNGGGPGPPRNIMCIIPGCQNRAFVDADGKATKFCSYRHRLYVYWVVTARNFL